MDQLTQADIIDMYRSQVANMEGGRRRRVGRPRKRRGRGLVGGVADASANVEGYISGMGLVGGRRRVGRPRGSTRPKMTSKVMEFFASRKRPRKRGRGLVGGKSNQELYDELVDQGQAITPEILELMKAGIQPATKKETLVRRIRSLEKKIGIGQSSAEKLNKYTSKALGEILRIYQENEALFAYPPMKETADLYDSSRFDDYIYDNVGFTAEQVAPLEEARQRRQEARSRQLKALSA
jgi:hypothetical protein